MKIKNKMRILAIWRAITSPNIILIEVKENVLELSRDLRVLCKTDYTDESDVLTLVAAKLELEERIKTNKEK